MQAYWDLGTAPSSAPQPMKIGPKPICLILLGQGLVIGIHSDDLMLMSLHDFLGDPICDCAESAMNLFNLSIPNIDC